MHCIISLCFQFAFSQLFLFFWFQRQRDLQQNPLLSPRRLVNHQVYSMTITQVCTLSCHSSQLVINLQWVSLFHCFFPFQCTKHQHTRFLSLYLKIRPVQGMAFQLNQCAIYIVWCTGHRKNLRQQSRVWNRHRLSVSALTAEPFDELTQNLVEALTLIISLMRSKVKVAMLKRVIS